MSVIWKLFLRNKGRVIHKHHHYFPIYERHFSKFIDQELTFLEIGCGKGGSLNIWKEYFGPYATIVGIDIREECKEFEDDQINVRIGDQSDPNFLKSIVDEFGPFDIILDDGSHVMSHIKASFEFLYPYVAKNGVYMVEDLHTAYWDNYEGGLKKEGTFIEIVKDLIDSLNWSHTNGLVPKSYFATNTTGIHCYDSIITFDKGANLVKTFSTPGYAEGSEFNHFENRINRLKTKLDKISTRLNPVKFLKNKFTK